MSVRVVLGPAAGAPVRAAAEREHAAAGDTSAGPDWDWVLDGSAVPRPGALAALLEAAERADAALLASAIVGRDGALAPGHVPLLPLGAPDVAMKAAALRLVPVRAVSGGSLVVRPGAAGGGDAFGWTASLLRGGRGFLVPDSVAEADGAGPGYHRLVLSAALTGRERLRLAAEVLERRRGRRGRSSPRSSG